MEDEPLLEELTVVHPLNETKADTVNYHQIVRARSQTRPASEEKKPMRK
jgi:hypothetical protein